MSLFSSLGAGLAKGLVGAFTDPIVKISQTIADTKVRLAAEANSAKRIELEEQVAGLEARRSVLTEEAKAGNRTNSLIRALIVLPWVIYWWKVLVFDKVFGAWTGWTTPALSPELAYIGTAIIGFFLVVTWKR